VRQRGRGHAQADLFRSGTANRKGHRQAGQFFECPMIWQQIGNKRSIPGCLEDWAAIATGCGGPERAARLGGAAAALRVAFHLPLPPIGRTDLEQGMPEVRAALGKIVFATTWAEGQILPIEQVIAEALEEAQVG
jgi:hypothetical protein